MNSGCLDSAGLVRNQAERFWIVTCQWLIMPVVICLSQKLSHACLSTNNSYETANGSLNQLQIRDGRLYIVDRSNSIANSTAAHLRSFIVTVAQLHSVTQC